MKRLIALLAVALVLSACAPAKASQTAIVIHDSIGSVVAQGSAKELAYHLVSAERDIVFKNLSSPGSSLGHTDRTGYNNANTINAIDIIRGAWNYYDFLIIAAGTNDYMRWVQPADTVASMRRILNKVRADGKKALVMPILWRANENTPNGIGYTVTSYRYVIALTCINEYPDVCYHAGLNNSPLMTNAGAATDYDATETAQGKQLHLNASGQRKLADYIKLELSNMEALRKASK